MKLNKLILFLLPALLTGCSSNPFINDLSIEQAQEVVNNMGNDIITDYRVTGAAYLAGVTPNDDNGNSFENKYRSYVEDVQTKSPFEDKKWGIMENIEYKYLSGSHFLGAPLRIKSFEFYKTKTVEGVGTSVEQNNCIYGYIQSLLIYQGSTAVLHMNVTEDNDLVFSVRNSSTFVTIYNFNWTVANYSGRINADIVYGANGYLKYEKVWSTNFKEGEALDPTTIPANLSIQETQFYLSSTYVY